MLQESKYMNNLQRAISQTTFDDLQKLNGRTKFDQTRYEKNDTLGKKLGLKYLMFMVKKHSNKKILPIFEDKKCGDIKLFDSDTNEITHFEIEVRNARDFQKNFEGAYSTVDIPLKKFDQIERGYYIAFDESEEYNDGIPRRMYGVSVSIIKQFKPKYKRTKFDPNNVELFYMIPKNLIKRYEFNEKKGKYIHVRI